MSTPTDRTRRASSWCRSERVRPASALVAVIVVVAACSGSAPDGIAARQRPSDVDAHDGRGDHRPQQHHHPDHRHRVGCHHRRVGRRLDVERAGGRRCHRVDRRGQAGRHDQPGDPRRVERPLTAAELQQAGLTINSWGGNPLDSVQLRHRPRVEPGADYEFRNTNYGDPWCLIAARLRAGPTPPPASQTRLAIPTLGWVAKNDDPDDCSFPDGSAGACRVRRRRLRGPEGRAPTRPARTSRARRRWSARGCARWRPPARCREFIAMDNEPDLWGNTHYDVHPTCPTYEEILDKYLAVRRGRTRGDARRCADSDRCCAAGTTTGTSPRDRPAAAMRTSVVVPRRPEVPRRRRPGSAPRLPRRPLLPADRRVQRRRRRRDERPPAAQHAALWDPDYTDESWIDTEAIRVHPADARDDRRRTTRHKLFISEWNFGTDARR